MEVKLKTDLLKADEFTDAEIAFIRHYLETAPSFDNTATVVRLRGETAGPIFPVHPHAAKRARTPARGGIVWRRSSRREKRRRAQRGGA